jgi:predicted alpha/beta superfamily hydrolase
MATLTIYGQKLIKIKVTVPNKTDDVYIVGNQLNLGDWNPDKVKMTEISDFEREISIELTFPAAFKFTRGTWSSEAIITALYHQPNFVINDSNDSNITYLIQGWTDEIKSFTLYSKFEITSINSLILNQNRKLFIYKPKNYNPEKKYPIVYITDADNLANYEVALQTLQQLSKFNLIPECILVGITQMERGKELDRNFGENGKKFSDFIFKELVPYINAAYQSSKYAILIGHSDGASFNHNLMFQEDNPFNAFINISDDLQKRYSFMNNNTYKNTLNTYKNYFNNYKGKEIKLFTASGNYDFWHRFAAAKTIDSLSRNHPNKNIKFEHKIYPAEHNELVAYAMQDALKFVFKEYRDFKSFKAHLKTFSNYKTAIDSLKNSIEKYGITYQFLDEDTDIINEIVFGTRNYDLFKQWNLEENKAYQFFTKLQIATILTDINPLEANKLYVEEIDKKNIDIMLYLPFYVHNNILVHNPKTTIAALLKLKSFNPNSLLEINYFIAKTSKEHTINKKIGQLSFAY